ncbi:hypothetical protein HHK36_010543 [Tetracentron sinense]|uniref:Uncharacterized protein n=1 Tax=Tetracentron sinense TaxID=13715 RepID=A0A834Z6I8_TETSI|nr:hypothetical protein HHK36_010543 [Tetracentron sinense]
MNRPSKESLAGGRSLPVGSQHRRCRNLAGISRDTDKNLDLFSRNRQSLLVASSDESDVAIVVVSTKLGRISFGSAKVARSGMDDLLSSVDGGKHDYDWLLTPPGTPLFPSSDGSEPQPTVAAPRSSSLVRSISMTKSSRLSVTQSENSYSSRPIRSSSVTRPSISTMQHITYSSNSNKSSSILNTSSASITSYARPSTPTARSTLPSTTRPSTPSSRPIPSRSSTPAKSQPALTSTSSENIRVSPNPRPSTPSSRLQIPANLNSPASRSNSRPSTPRRAPAPTPTPGAGHSASTGRVLSNGRNSAPASRPSSPSPRARLPQQPIVLPDFPHDTPPNLRTTLPDRPISAGRSRPGVAVTVKGKSEPPGPVNLSRRQSSPVVTRGRLPELSGRGRLHANGHGVEAPESRKTSLLPEPVTRRPVKPAMASESTGFGRTISKKSLDMALRHMVCTSLHPLSRIVYAQDIRHGGGSIRPISGTTVFPQSIRSGTPKGQPACLLDAPVSVSSNESPPIGNNGTISENGNYINGFPNGETEGYTRVSAKLRDPDMYESSRYDAILLKEDLKNTNWLHGLDDQEPIFDHRFEPLPEPFGLF